MFRKAVLLWFLAACLIGVTAAAAQDEAVAEGLNFPRGVAYDADGNLYIAEPGTGGDTVVAEMDGMQITAGLSGQVTMIAPDGTASVVIGNLPSAFVPFEGAALGVQRAVPDGDTLWLVLSEAQNMLVFSDAVVQVDKATGRVLNFIELFRYEQENNPDGTEEIYSNPSDVAVGPDGIVYIVDTGANTLYTWTAESGLQALQAWENTVPTAIEIGPDGSLYVGFLGTGIAPGAGHIEQWSADGSELLATYEGMTAVTDILVDADGNIYAVQLAQVGEQGPAPASGSVVQVTADGFTPVAEGLNTPFGLAQDAEGNLVVSTGAAFAEPGSGTVVRVAAGM